MGLITGMSNNNLVVSLEVLMSFMVDKSSRNSESWVSN